ncbi:myb dna- protein [Fusarium langsethiae]|uniref:Myb dna-protein n=1 Tax=Fusarium langsethiae TaxID=179993 RepID=A0A0N0DGZ9_FUSLA|nr:myb dna- protein [Fusarium langsethiae]GKU00660.1 unnamed protein product [Fusarium langsethiae]GKU14816.1 unnamed protein product [Fusarium langsethiae]
MSSNGTGNSKWRDFRLASTLLSLIPGSQPNTPQKQNNNDDAAGHGPENEQQHESKHQNELREESYQSPKVTHEDMDAEAQLIDGIGGLESYEDDVQAGSDDGGQDQDFGVLEMFDSNATQAPYSSQINSASLNQKAPEAFMTEEPPSSQIRKHKREKKERKRKDTNDSASPQPTEEDSSRKHRKSKKKSVQSVEIPDSLANDISSNTYQSLPGQISAVDLNDDDAAPATQTKRKRKTSDPTDGKRRKKHRSRDDGAATESQDGVPETQDAQPASEEVNTHDPEAASFLHTRNASRPGAIYDDVAEDTPGSPSATRLETRDAQSREGSAVYDEMELDASAAQGNQNEDTEQPEFLQYNGSQDPQVEDIGMATRQAWSEQVHKAQNNIDIQGSAEQHDEMEIPTSAQRPRTTHDVYDVPGSPIPTPNPPSTNTKKSRSAKAKKAKPTFFEKSPSPEQDEFAPLQSPSAMMPAARKRAKKVTNRNAPSQSMQDADDDQNSQRRGRMDGHTKGRFSDEELSRIARAVEAYRSTNNMEQYKLNEMIHTPGGTTASDEHADLWAQIFQTCPDRHRQKIINITRKKFHNFVARGTWTTEQDMELRDLMEVHDKKWSKIAGIINRHPEDIRDRWRNYIVCGEMQRKDTWDEQEERNLTQIVMESIAHIDPNNERPYMDLIDWQEISKRMGRTRSRLQCITKWRAMNIKTHGKDKLASNAPDSSISFRLEKARRQIAAMPDEERYRMVMAIQNTTAQSDSKIPWQRLVDKKFRASWHRPTQSLLWHRLKKTVPGQEGKIPSECATYLMGVYSQTGELPNVEDALQDDTEEMKFMEEMDHLHHGHNVSAERVNDGDDDEQQAGEYGISDENIQPDLPIAPMEHLDPAPMASMDSVAPVADLAPMDPAEMVDPALSAEPVEAVEATPLEEKPEYIEEEEVLVAKPVDTPEFFEPAPPKATRVAKRTGMGKAKAPRTPRKASARSTPVKATSTRRNTRRAAALSRDPIEDDGEAQPSAPGDDDSEVDEAKARKRKTPSRFRSTTAADFSVADDSDSVMDDMEDMPARIV